LTFSVFRLFLYSDPPTLLRPKLYFDLNLTSTFLSQLYFDFFGTTWLRPFSPNFISTSLLWPKLYFDLFISTKTVLRPVLVDQYETPIWQKVEVERSKLIGQSRAVELQKKSKIWKWSKYRKGRTNAYPRSEIGIYAKLPIWQI